MMTLRQWGARMVPARALMLVVGTLFHLCYVLSIFDIYFKSPVVHGMTPHRVHRSPPAKRLVLIVADGLRADKLFQLHPERHSPHGEAKSRAPFLRSLVRDSGTFGVSHTRVPTESRPGHVALIAGMYEDVSAVTKGWKENPVNFDSVFNQSSTTWAFGSPDIIEMFKMGATDPDRVQVSMYAAEDEDFTADSTKLDTWVFNEFEKLLLKSKMDTALDARLRSDQVVIFLHLLGLDTSGHAFKPYSEEYLHNIQIVDSGLEQTVRKIERFYHLDGKTTYIFTADHGMSDRGNHGDGHPDNTRTPLVAWGAGIQRPRYSINGSKAQGHDDFSADWYLDDVERFDVEQADIATLMATLIGLHHPMNSVGELPLDYLDMPDDFLAEAALTNCKSLIEQYWIKMQNKKSHVLFFKPFPKFTGKSKSEQARLQALDEFFAEGKYEHAIRGAMQLNKLVLEGIRYLDTYDRFLLSVIVTSGYLGWMLYAAIFIFRVFVIPFDAHLAKDAEYQRLELAQEGRWIEYLPSALAVISIISFFVQRSPLTYHLYTAFPLFYLDQVLRDRHLIKLAFASSIGDTLQNQFMRLSTFALKVLLTLVALQVMVVGYFDRRVWSLGFVLLATVWPASMPITFLKSQWPLVLLWAIFALATSIFTLLPVDTPENVYLIMTGGLLAFLISCFVFCDFCTDRRLFQEVKMPFQAALPRLSSRPKSLAFLYLALMAINASIVTTTYLSIASIRAKNGLPQTYQTANWTLLGMSLIMTSMAPEGTRPSEKLFVLALASMPIYVILTESFEGIFFVCYTCTLLTWCALESRLYASTRALGGSNARAQRPLALDDVRIGLFFLFFIHVGFFGTGNVASISSFYLNPVYRLIPIFRPFPMAALLIAKMLVPFIMICSILGVLTRNIDLDPFGIFMAVFALSDVLSLDFFFLVKDSGSWLDIGQSISHFIISSFFIFSNFIVFSLVVKEGRHHGLYHSPNGQSMKSKESRQMAKTK